MARGLDEEKKYFRRIESIALSTLPTKKLTTASKADNYHDGVMVALVPDDPYSLVVGGAGSLPANELHVTLCYLGRDKDFTNFDKTKILKDVRNACDKNGSAFSTTADGVVVMGQNDEGILATALLVQSDDIVRLYDAISDALNFESESQSFISHITTGYGTPVESTEAKVGQNVAFNNVVVTFGNDQHVIPLTTAIVAAPRTANVLDRVIDSLGRLWDEALHPRDGEGRFIKKNGAVSGKLAVPTRDRKGVTMVDANRASVVGFHTFGEDVWVLAEITNQDGSTVQGFARAFDVRAVAPVKARLDALYPINYMGDDFIDSSLERKRQLDLILAHINTEFGSSNDENGAREFIDSLGLWENDIEYLNGGDDDSYLGGLRRIDRQLSADELDEQEDIIDDTRSVKELRDRIHGLKVNSDTLTVTVPYSPELIGERFYIGDEAKTNGVTVRGVPMAYDDERLPPVLYHVTTNSAAVRKSGHLQASGEGGLGGDSNDRIVSLTVDKEVAEGLQRDLRMYAELHSILGENPPGNRGDPEHQEWETNAFARLQGQAMLQGWEFKRFWAGSGVPDFGYSLNDWLSQFFVARSSATNGKMRNPIIFRGADWDNISPDNIEIIEVDRADVVATGAMLTDFDLDQSPNGLSEVRLYGDVPIKGTKVLDSVSDIEKDSVRTPAGVKKFDALIGAEIVPGVHVDLAQKAGHVSIGLIRTDEDKRGQGLADKQMKAIIEQADAKGITLSLSAEPLAGDTKTKKTRLASWYKSHGFVPNKGRKIDFSISDSMVRLPRSGQKFSIEGPEATVPSVGVSAADLRDRVHSQGKYASEDFHVQPSQILLSDDAPDPEVVSALSEGADPLTLRASNLLEAMAESGRFTVKEPQSPTGASPIKWYVDQNDDTGGSVGLAGTGESTTSRAYFVKQSIIGAEFGNTDIVNEVVVSLIQDDVVAAVRRPDATDAPKGGGGGPTNASDFDGPTVERGMTLVLSDEEWAKVDRLLRPPTTPDELGQEFKIGPMLVEIAKAGWLARSDRVSSDVDAPIEVEGGLGRNWTTNPEMAKTAATATVSRNTSGRQGIRVVFTAKIRKSDVENRPQMMRDMFTSEAEVRLRPGSEVHVQDVKIIGRGSVWPRYATVMDYGESSKAYDEAIAQSETIAIREDQPAGAQFDAPVVDDSRMLKIPRSVFGDNPEWDGTNPPGSEDPFAMERTHQPAHVVSQHAGYLVPSDWSVTDILSEDIRLDNGKKDVSAEGLETQAKISEESIGSRYGNSIAKMIIWDFILLNGDRNPGNAVLASPPDGSEGLVIPIDHGSTFDPPFERNADLESDRDAQQLFDLFMKYPLTSNWIEYVEGGLSSSNSNVTEETLRQSLKDFVDVYSNMSVESILSKFRTMPGVTDEQVARIEESLRGSVDRLNWVRNNIDSVLQRLIGE